MTREPKRRESKAALASPTKAGATPGAPEFDPVTVTTWRSFDAMRSWAYGPGAHRHFLDRHRAETMADRTSFTRCRILESAGTWYREALGR